jgi:molecular chaperone GrpE
VKPDPEPSEFDAVAAAKELEDELGELGAGLGADGKDDSYVAVLEGEIEQLALLVAQKDEQLRLANVRADQAHAEIEAVQRRVAGASAKDLEQRTRKLLASFLPVVDNLDRAIAAATTHAQGRELLEGIELVRREVLTSLATFDVKHLPALGERFDPNRHEAIAVVAVGDPAQDGRVIDVVREGYVIGEDTLRPAGVAVGKRTAS